ncbi:MAG: hypothetical protein RLZ57_341 [Actinomycetota bacterium]|jgi:hypothetical protein
MFLRLKLRHSLTKAEIAKQRPTIANNLGNSGIFANINCKLNSIPASERIRINNLLPKIQNKFLPGIRVAKYAIGPAKYATAKIIVTTKASDSIFDFYLLSSHFQERVAA